VVPLDANNACWSQGLKRIRADAAWPASGRCRIAPAADDLTSDLAFGVARTDAPAVSTNDHRIQCLLAMIATPRSRGASR